MLKQRILTALVLAPLALAGVIFLSPAVFSVLTALIIMLAAWEWANLAGFEQSGKRILFSLFTGLVCWLVSGLSHTLVLSIGAAWWVVALVLVKGYPKTAAYCQNQVLRLFMGILTLVPAWFALVQLKQFDHTGMTILFVFFLVWAADVGAYFAGRALGKHKLAVNVSPKKTLEGLVGGLLLSLLVAACVGLYFEFTFARGMGLLLLTVVVGIVSVLGDLFESLLKRERGIKDSSNLLPGHGGILDRIDSLTAAVPVFALALLGSGG
ncbi:phosphatidate cytidylyltransferase [Endozoicomonas montiporae]|uniref:Phosphatidate cytidylyltransferase n=2 Tax=Endozoicomonas montiporae TaxID=1027273 RepID=A0A081NBN0_9GAMM|nr:phosphatidate cytidylyltransferase [Endozoicomonas montiporae]AMO56147.1 phosphatidate cytidylyltransferase [Endozoicomonas montiporae CL-33]KEQ15853.1 phosphatidate cytidylyltransferase [Endozoicomonas montiporae]